MEQARALRFLQRVTVIRDNLSIKAQGLRPTRSLDTNDIIILGTGDQMGIVTMTNEVVEMVEEDLEKQTQTYQKDIYTVEIIKQQFKTLREAKKHLKLKATSWESLVNKVNDSFSQNIIPENQALSDRILESKNTREIESDRKNSQGLAVYLESDVAEIFPNSQAVNEALRFLIRVTKENR